MSNNHVNEVTHPTPSSPEGVVQTKPPEINDEISSQQLHYSRSSELQPAIFLDTDISESYVLGYN